MRGILLAGLCALALAGCQTPQESFIDADITCREMGYRPGTRAFENCRAANYHENRRESAAAANAAAVGIAAGALTGVAIAAAASPRGYYYRRCGPWGCW